MATLFVGAQPAPVSKRGEIWHKLRLRTAIVAVVAVILGLAIHGFSYYILDLTSRAQSPLHYQLRPSGTIGLRLGITGLCLYLILFLYPLRKRWAWLASIGKTRHWLDFHVLVGITAPILITFHASFKLGGLAGVAYWIMIAVALSGFVGRYIYAQIPRSLNAVQLTMGEMATQASELAAQLDRQALFKAEELAPLLRLPTADEVRAMPLTVMLFRILKLDLARPFEVSRLRRRVLRGAERFTTLGGLLASRNQELEQVITSVRRQSWLRGKTTFLERTQQVFHLWHVVHRPFSYSFAVLVVVHIGVVLLLGYY